MKIIVIGAGEVGSYLCKILSERNHEVTVIENSETVAAAIEETQNVKVLNGNGSSAQTLSEAAVGDSDFFLAMTSDDRTNLVACSLAKALGAETTIARVHDQTYTDNTYVNYQVHFGVDIMLNPEALCAVELAKEIRNPDRVAVENFARGQIEVQNVKVTTARSLLVGKPLGEVKMKPEVRVGYVQRGDLFEVATAETVIKPGDSLTLFGTTEALFELKPKLDPESKISSLRVVLFGGDETAVALTRLLNNSRFKVRILEKDPRLCRSLAERFPHITVINGDATSLRLLEEEQISSSDYFVACTKDDEDNVMTCLQASKLGARHVHLIINKADYEEVIKGLKDTLGLEAVLSPRIATVNEVLRYLSKEAYIELGELPGGAGKILEMVVPPNSPCHGKSIRELPLPKGSLIVALLHKYQAKVPSADDKLLSGDRVVIIIQQSHVQELLEMLN